MTDDEIRVRNARQEDLPLTFAWANDRTSRQNSFRSETIAFETHQAWFLARLKDESGRLYIIEKQACPMGMVRFEKKGATIISIVVAPEFRGKRWSTTMLRLALREYWKDRDDSVYAYIKSSNERSLKTFQRAGFRFVRADSVRGAACHVLRLDKNENSEP